MSKRDARSIVVVILLVLLLGTTAHLAAAAGTTWYVDDGACPGPGTGTVGDPFCLVQDAIDAAAADDIIEIAAGTYSEHLVLNKSLTFNGAGRTATILDGGGSGRVLLSGAAYTVSLHSLTIQHGSADIGGGIYNLGKMTLDDVLVQYNQSVYYGGGIYHGAFLDKLSLMNSEVSNNQATDATSGGGGVYSEGPLILEGTTIDSNSAGYEGGGLDLYGADSLLDMSNSTVTGNSVTASNGSGGGIASALGSATIFGSTISGNTATGTGGDGGGISTNTSMNLQYSLVTGNTADDVGGGIMHWYGDLNVTHTAVRSNTILDANGAGGGIYASLGTLTLSAVEVSGNSAPYAGGGVDSGAAATITNTTVSGNSSQFGGGLLISSAGSSSLLNSTVTGNFEPSGSGVGGIYAASALTIKNTIFAANQGDECWDVSGPNITSLGHNIEDTDTCGFSVAGDQPNTDPLLGPLGDNGGETYTHRLLPGSPAIDAGTNTGCPASDQRDIIRPIDGDQTGPALCDVGAFEAMIPLFLPLIMR